MSTTIEDFDPRLKRVKTFTLIGLSIITEYEKQLNHSKGLIDERDFPKELNTKRFAADIEGADLGAAQKRRLLSILRQAGKDLERANELANYVRYQWQCHSWNWQAEKAEEDLRSHPSIADDLKARMPSFYLKANSRGNVA
jgi:hypothetical protein